MTAEPEIPNGWTTCSVDEIGTVIGGGTPSRAIARYWNGTIPWVTPGELTGLATKYLVRTAERITGAGLEGSGAQLLPPNSLLVTSRATLGSVALTLAATCTNQGFKSIVFHRSSSPDFYFHLFKRLTSELERRASGTTFLEISSKDFRDIRVPCPPLPEQLRIAEILDTVDNTIQNTEQLIRKLKQMKVGLVHDLLTRGVDENGELRDPQRNPELFKASPFGPVPGAWNVVTLRDEIRIAHGYPFEGAGFTDKPNGPVLLTPGNFHRDGGLYFEENTKYYTKIVPVGFTLAQDDIVTVMTDLSPNTLILGRTEIVQVPFPLLHNQRIGKVLINDKKRWIPKFLALTMSHPNIRAKIIREATGTTVRHTSPDRILSSKVWLPGIKEQQRILDRMVAADEKSRVELQSLQQLRALRVGLMEDLLTGRVRTTVLNGATA